MFIRNGQARADTVRPCETIENPENTESNSNIFDISELNQMNRINQTSQRQARNPEAERVVSSGGGIYNRAKNAKNTKRSRKKYTHETPKEEINRFAEYLSGRKYYILVLSFIYIAGLLVGAVLVKNLEKKEVFELSSMVDNYFSGIPSINMTARIFANIVLSLVFLFGIYICGATVFSPFICSAFCLYKGLSGGFMIGVHIIGGSTLFHLGICGINFILSLFAMIFFILACGESMSFSSFLFRSEENFRSSLSFKNVSVYSSRFLLFLILIAMAAVVQTVVPPVLYAVWG